MDKDKYLVTLKNWVTDGTLWNLKIQLINETYGTGYKWEVTATIYITDNRAESENVDEVVKFILDSPKDVFLRLEIIKR